MLLFCPTCGNLLLIENSTTCLSKILSQTNSEIACKLFKNSRFSRIFLQHLSLHIENKEENHGENLSSPQGGGSCDGR